MESSRGVRESVAIRPGAFPGIPDAMERRLFPSWTLAQVSVNENANQQQQILEVSEYKLNNSAYII